MNKDILIKANALITQGDYEGFLYHCTEDTIWEFVGDQTLTGKEAVRNYMAQQYQQPPHFDVSSIIEDGESVTVIGQITMKGVTYDYCDNWTFRGGKMAKLKAFVIERK